ncbi:Pls/PosA family non-ribosomal peptide synthetase [Pedobacter cryoconitis]|uniref:Non-ribosomal peptide synthetase-like protein n=1 Tax=Pedobacter cryoconitis TaxID=188932 RepID=A0A7X0J3S8_9SPHI|nr:Pls/PosA family non-ribosomal peptide synthetase [Pedobacter cryoconitis]MBB6499257.1 non-ribosomal peptide synthetase-like protein [Pedobacter cryoconitis]
MNELTGPSKQTLNLLSAVTGTVYVLLNKYQAYLKDTVKLELSFAETGKPGLRSSPLEFQYPLENNLSFNVLTEKIAHAVEAYHDLSEENFTLHIKWISDDQANDYHIAIHIENGDVTGSDFSCKETAFYAVVFKQAPNHFITVLQQVAENPGILLSDLIFMDDQELDRLAGYQAGLVDNSVGTPELLHSLFEHTAYAFPQNRAVCTANRQVSYHELDQAANKLAAELIEKGVKEGDFVGILLKRSPEVYLAMLAILKAGAAYVPLDTGYPEDRVSFILEDCGAKFLLSDEICSSSFKLSCQIITVDDNSFELHHHHYEAPDIAITVADAAYMIYTSGSTGRPKGVIISHAAISNLVKGEERLFEVGPHDKVAQVFSVAFDASLEEIWLAFRSGATLFPVSEAVMHSGADLSDYILKYQLTVLSTVPTMLSMMQYPLPSLRLLILGGENCPHELLLPWHSHSLRIVNTYGPTEATVIATYADFDPLHKITIGKPAVNYNTYILDEQQLPVPIGVPGELCIGGPGLAIGYLHQPELTAEKFIQPVFPLPENMPRCLYRSGDLARFNDDGNIEFLGRIDLQVKLRGYRIELSEIESQLLQIDSIKNAVVAVKEDEQKVQRLVAYLILKGEKDTFNEEVCKTQLKSRLAPYMVPAVFVLMDAFPLLASGKVDRKLLPQPARQQHKTEGRKLVGARTETEAMLLTVWKKYFEPQEVSVTDDFFDLGGHSLVASMMVSELRKTGAAAQISVQDIYTCRTLQKLAAKIETIADDQEHSSQEKTEPVVRLKVSGFQKALTSGIQLISVLVFFMIGSAGLMGPFIVRHFGSATNVYDLLIYGVVGFSGIFFSIILLSIIAKWVLIGKFKAGRYPLWGWYFLRFWIVKKLIDLSPIGILSGTPFLKWYFSLMGAKIGKRVFLGSDRIRVFDLLSIGDGSSISKEAHLLGYKIEDGALIIGSLTIGENCFVGTRSVISCGAVMEDGSSVGELSQVQSDTAIPAGAHWKGTPAVPAGIHKPAETFKFSGQNKPMNFALYVTLLIVTLGFVFLFPFGLSIPFIAIYYEVIISFGLGWAIALSIPISAMYIIIYCSSVALFKWLVIGKLEEEAFSIYSFKYIRKWVVDSLMNMSLTYFRSVYATIYLSSWLRLMGTRIGKATEISTVNQITTDLVKIGAGSFLADSVSLGSPEVHQGTMYLRRITIGNKTFIGNSAVISSGDTIGSNCLIGVLSTPPANVERKYINDSSWLGAPPMYLPKRQESVKFPDDLTFRPTNKLYMQRGIIELFKITLPYAITSTILLLFYYFIDNFYDHSDRHIIHTLCIAPFLLLVLIKLSALLTILFKKILIGTYKPSNKPLWSMFVWKNELVNSLCENMVYPLLVNSLLGTPFAPIFFRMMGCEIGKDVYMDTSEITEFDLVHVGDHVAINHMCTLQTHLFEDRVMKMAHLHIGDYCNIGAMSVVLYDSTIEEGATLQALSLVMKGETIPKHTQWAGSPAKFVK